MPQTTFDIDGPIGKYAFSKQFVKTMLSDAGSADVQCNISSPGGDIDHGINIHDQFVDHGNVAGRLSGFVASAATVIGCGCKITRMNSTSLYLVHQVSGWIDEWGYKNADELDEIISKLTQEKEENQKIDLIIARIYAGKTGKSINELVVLMKQNKWLNAEEALEWGFIDEIIPMEGKQNLLEDKAKVAMIQSLGLPMPERRNAQPVLDTTEKERFINYCKSFINDLLFDNKDKSNNSHKNRQQMNKTKYAAVFSVLGVESMESTNEGTFLNAEQLETINTALAGKQAAETERTSVLNALDTLDPKVKEAQGHEAKIAAVKEKLARIPGQPPAGNDGGDNGDQTDEVDWEVINNLPHNKQADSNY